MDMSAIYGEISRGNKSRRIRSESTSSDGHTHGVSKEAQQQRGYKLMEEPTKSLIEGVDISYVLTMELHLCDSQWESFRIIFVYVWSCIVYDASTQI